MIAHVSGVPLEELLALTPGAGTLLLFARAALYGRGCRRRRGGVR